MTCFLILSHASFTGCIELSTHYSWQAATDELVVNTGSKTITARYPDEASAQNRPARVMNIPLEKIWPRPLQQDIYLQHGFIPSDTLHSIYLQGFYPQIRHFASSVEKGRTGKFSSLESLLPVYDVLQKLQDSLSG